MSELFHLAVLPGREEFAVSLTGGPNGLPFVQQPPSPPVSHHTHVHGLHKAPGQSRQMVCLVWSS